MNENIKARLKLSLKFSLVSLLIFIVTGFLITLFAFMLFDPGIESHVAPWDIIPAMLISVAIVGTIVSFFMGDVPLKPVRKTIEATDRLARGDFSTRLELSHPSEFRELAESFNRMAEELEGTEILRSDFINNFSHEFKTPIVSIRGFAEVLAHDDLSEEERNEYLHIIIKESDRLAQLATKVLDLSRVENQMILSDKTSFNLAEQIRQAIILVESKWEAKSIQVSADLEELQVTGDAALLDEVWLNLLDNAIKFTPAQGTIDITLQREGDMVAFRLTDSGIGIDDSAGERLFDKFYQADVSRTTQGNGLGLAIAQRIVKLHEGTIGYESEPGMGTTFIVRLPAE